MFNGISGHARTILIIEIIVGVLILIAGIFVLTTEGNAPTVSPSPIPTPQFSTYISSLLQISLEYPYGWEVDPEFNGIPGIERYKGSDGFFEVGATNDPTPKKGMIIKKYSKPIILGETKYRYFTLKADAEHLKSISDSITFL
ncbi:MAG: hypothetical protein AAB420_02705 [Patescibacteria group bacterium]